MGCEHTWKERIIQAKGGPKFEGNQDCFRCRVYHKTYPVLVIVLIPITIPIYFISKWLGLHK